MTVLLKKSETSTHFSDTLVNHRHEIYVKILLFVLLFLSIIGLIASLLFFVFGVCSIPVCISFFCISQLCLVITSIFLYKYYRKSLEEKILLQISQIFKNQDLIKSKPILLIPEEEVDVESLFSSLDTSSVEENVQEDTSDFSTEKCLIIERSPELCLLMEGLSNYEFFSDEGLVRLCSFFQDSAEKNCASFFPKEGTVEGSLILYMKYLSQIQKLALVELAKYEVIDEVFINANKTFFKILLEYPFFYFIIRNRCYLMSSINTEESSAQWSFPGNDLSDFHDYFYNSGNDYFELRLNYNSYCDVVNFLIKNPKYNWPASLKEMLNRYYLIDEDLFFSLERLENPLDPPTDVFAID